MPSKEEIVGEVKVVKDRPALYIGIAGQDNFVGSIAIVSFVKYDRENTGKHLEYVMSEYSEDEELIPFIDSISNELEYNQIIIPVFSLKLNKVQDILPRRIEKIIYETLNHYYLNINDIDIFISDYSFLPGIEYTAPCYSNVWCRLARAIAERAIKPELDVIKKNNTKYRFDCNNFKITLNSVLELFVYGKQEYTRAMSDIDYQICAHLLAVSEYFFVLKFDLYKDNYSPSNISAAGQLKTSTFFLPEMVKQRKHSVTKIKKINFCNNLKVDKRCHKHYLEDKINFAVHMKKFIREEKYYFQTFIISFHNSRNLLVDYKEQVFIYQFAYFMNYYSFFIMVFYDGLAKLGISMEDLYRFLMYSVDTKTRPGKEEYLSEKFLKQIEKGNNKTWSVSSNQDYRYLQKN